jgi:UDP-N-acetylglucosamine 1-carboxyvinyltransferase
MAIAAAITEGTAYLMNEAAARMKTIIPVLCNLGLKAETNSNYIKLSGTVRFPVQVETGEFPAFPSDLVPLLTALLAKVPGESRVIERIYESRFDHMPYLVEMGIKCTCEGNEAKITGGTVMHGVQARGSGIRETAALVLAALNAHGITEVSNAAALARGYQNLPMELAEAGANIIEHSA